LHQRAKRYVARHRTSRPGQCHGRRCQPSLAPC
jgi:hypothetical protein